MADVAFSLPYAGAGLDRTPPAVSESARVRARALAGSGWTLRTGAHLGLESALEAGALEGGGSLVITLPWEGFNGHLAGISADRFGMYGVANRTAAKYCPGWEHLPSAQRRVLVTTLFQLLGRNLRDPAKFLLCWAKPLRYSPSGEIVDAPGHVGLAVRLARAHDIPVYCPDYYVSMVKFEQDVVQWEAPRGHRDVLGEPGEIRG